MNTILIRFNFDTTISWHTKPDIFSQSWLDDKTQWTTRYGCIAGLAELGPDVGFLLFSNLQSSFLVHSSPVS